MRKPLFENDTLYHLYNRGVEKRTTFTNQADYMRFIYGLHEFNDEVPAEESYYKRLLFKSSEVQPRRIDRDMLVEIVAFCLMPNHFHLLLRQLHTNGIVKFMQKLGTGYTMYFNKKYQRVGSLFQGRFKAVTIKTHEHFLYLPHYIHLNPITMMQKPLKNNARAIQQKLNFLKSYRWSSYRDFIGEKNFLSPLSHMLIQELYGTNEEYKQSITEWLRDVKNDELKEVVFDE